MVLQSFRTDDLNGDHDASTTVITVNGKGIELDLAEKSATRLAKALEPFWKVGSESDYAVTKVEPRARRASTAAPAPVRDWDINELRQWAEANDIELPSRGRIPAHIVEQFKAR